MTMPPPRRLPWPRVGAVVVVMLGLVASWTAVEPAAAAQTRVEVRRGSYAPRVATVHVGDTVVWTWTVDGESVTADDGSFDSHQDCGPLRPSQCGVEGDTFSHTFRTAGTVTYTSRQTGAQGTVYVAEAPPSPSPTSEPEPTDDSTAPLPDPSPAPTRTDDPEPQPDEPSSPSPSPTRSGHPDRPPATDDGDAGDDPAPSDDGPRPEPTTRTAAPDTVDRVDATADDTETPLLDAPSVAEGDPSPVPEPTFDDFPDATEPTAPDVEGEVAIDSDDGGDTGRVVWGTIGGLSVLGTLGAFARRVLFADPWDA